MNVIWLASWFPNRTDPSLGDFIERHAHAVAPFLNKLVIISVVKDISLPVNIVETVVKSSGNIDVHLVYYGSSQWGGAVDRLLSLRRNISLYQQAFDKIVAGYKLPDMLHVHVAMKAGLFAQKIKRQFNIPYIVTEHSSVYYADAKPSLKDTSWYFRYLTKKVLQFADMVLPVSNTLGKAICTGLVNVPYKVVPNVVDTNIFFPTQIIEQKAFLRLIHVSGMGYPKNMEAIFSALKILKQQGIPFIMDLYGPLQADVQQMAIAAGLQDKIIFKGEVLQKDLAPAMQQADALVLYSRYETFGCVLIEANACGLPVIVSELPVFHEIIREGDNGVFVPGNDAKALAAALVKFNAEKNRFDKTAIALEAARKYNYNAVGQQLMNIYKGILT